MHYITSPLKSHVDVLPEIRATCKFFTHYFPLCWSSNIICALGWMTVWNMATNKLFFMENSSLNFLLNIAHAFPMVSKWWQAFRLGFLRWTIPLKSFLWRVLVLPRPPAAFTLLHRRDLCFLSCRMHCACDPVGKYGPEIPGQSVKGPNALVPVQWVQSWIRHDPYSHTTKAWPTERHVLGEEKYVGV